MTLPTCVPGAIDKPELLRVLAALQNCLKLASSSDDSAAIGFPMQQAIAQVALKMSLFMVMMVWVVVLPDWVRLRRAAVDLAVLLVKLNLKLNQLCNLRFKHGFATMVTPKNTKLGS